MLGLGANGPPIAEPALFQVYPFPLKRMNLQDQDHFMFIAASPDDPYVTMYMYNPLQLSLHTHVHLHVHVYTYTYLRLNYMCTCNSCSCSLFLLCLGSCLVNLVAQVHVRITNTCSNAVKVEPPPPPETQPDTTARDSEHPSSQSRKRSDSRQSPLKQSRKKGSSKAPSPLPGVIPEEEEKSAHK